MSIGAVGHAVNPVLQSKVEGYFKGSGYKLDWQSDMDSWLWCHMALILPICYVSYKEKCNLRTASDRQCKRILDAAGEAMELLQKAGYMILPEGDEQYYKPGAKYNLMHGMLLAMGKSKLGDLCATEHCRHAVTEMEALEKAWNEMRSSYPDQEMYAWDTLRYEMPDWEELEQIYSEPNTGEAGPKQFSRKKALAAAGAITAAAALTAAGVQVARAMKNR